MKRQILIAGTCVALAGCGGITDRFDLWRKDDSVGAPVDPFVRPAPEAAEATLAPETAAPPPAAAAVTAEALDTTTPAQRAAASAAADGAVQALGATSATLGSPTEPGLWLKTPLVKTEAQGRVTNTANGKSSLVTLIPIDGPETGGSRMSLAAMRLIGASLTDIVEVDVALES